MLLFPQTWFSGWWKSKYINATLALILPRHNFSGIFFGTLPFNDLNGKLVVVGSLLLVPLLLVPLFFVLLSFVLLSLILFLLVLLLLLVLLSLVLLSMEPLSWILCCCWFHCHWFLCCRFHCRWFTVLDVVVVAICWFHCPWFYCRWFHYSAMFWKVLLHAKLFKV